jgi:hypothetical protein
MQFETREEVRDFLRLCLNPGHGVTRTPNKLVEIMPETLRERLEGYAPHLAGLRQEAERAQAATEQARAAHADALTAWLTDDDTAAAPVDDRTYVFNARSVNRSTKHAHDGEGRTLCPSRFDATGPMPAEEAAGLPLCGGCRRALEDVR